MKLSLSVLVLSLSAHGVGWCIGQRESPGFRFVGMNEIPELAPAPATPADAAVPWTATPHFRKILDSFGNTPYELVLEESEARISATKIFKAHGHFEKFSATASIDKTDFKKSEIAVSLDANSAVSDSWFLSTKTLKSKLKAAEFPTATLKSLSIRPTAAVNHFEIESDLSLMGENIKKNIPVVLVVLENGNIRASGSFDLTVDGTNGTMTFNFILRPRRSAAN